VNAGPVPGSRDFVLSVGDDLFSNHGCRRPFYVRANEVRLIGHTGYEQEDVRVVT